MIGMTLVVFVLSNIVPADPARIAVGEYASERELELARERLGLNKPLHTQYFIYLNNLLKLDLGTSLRNRRPVLQQLMVYFPATIELALFSTILFIFISINLGLLAARNRDLLLDNIVRITSIGGLHPSN